MIEKTQEKIAQLEAAIKHLESIIKHLSYNAGEIKSQIHTSVSRHLEAMRNREVWLLGQVDLIVSAKEEVLHHQQVRLNKALGVLQSSLDLAEDDDGLESRLADALDKLDISELKPEETPYILFRADQSTLRESVMNYGRVDATGFPLQSAFVAHGHPSTSLPRHFEEYEDPEHHVFYKTVEEVNRARTASNNISVNIPKLSQRPEDWLCRPTTVTTSTTSAPRFSFPSLSPNNADWLRQKEKTSTQSSLTGDSSIQNWLSQLKQFPDLEDEDFEIIDRDQAVSSTRSGNSITVMPVFETTLTSDPFQKLSYPSPVEAWLKSSSRSNEKVCEKEVFDLFKHISSDQDKWLIRDMNKEADTCSDCLCYNKASEIENLGNLTCATQLSEWVYRGFPRDMKKWLKKSSDSDDQTVPGRICKANEPCLSFDDCVCQPICGSPKKWLKSTGSRLRLSTLPQIEGFSRYLKSLDTEKEQWLKGSGGLMNVESTTLPEKFPIFDSISSNIDDWLRDRQPGRNKNSPSITDFNFEFKHGKEDHNIWLKVNGSQPAQPTTPAEPCCTWDKIQKHVDKMSKDDWLLKQSDSEDKDNGDEKENAVDKWVLTRSPSPEIPSRFSKISSDLGEWLYQKNL